MKNSYLLSYLHNLSLNLRFLHNSLIYNINEKYLLHKL